MPLGMDVGLGPGDFVFDGDPAPRRKKDTAPIQFLATEVDLGPVLDGDPATPAKGAQQPPSFRPMSIVTTVAHLSNC